MRVMIVGSGGRECALARCLSASKGLEELVIAPGNPGTTEYGRNIEVGLDDVVGLVAAARSERIDLVVVGPEIPLSLGLSDELAKVGIVCFGPSASAARIESSKAFSTAFMERNGIPTASARIFSDAREAKAYATILPRLPVVKASGLSAGKGVIICKDLEEAIHEFTQMLEKERFGVASAKVVIEEFLSGIELSV
ncbi:MAG: phosphoribosylamine--glycine ligase, partial [Spirochaetota bacterium]